MNLRSPIFISYAHKDRQYLDKVLTHLEPSRMQDQVCAWSDKDIEPGSNWAHEMEFSTINAKVFLLLISKHYLSSKYIRESELPRLLSEKQSYGRPIIPILLSPCLYEMAVFYYPHSVVGPEKFELSTTQFFNDPNRPLSVLSANNQDIAFVR